MGDRIALPGAATDGEASVERAISRRRSRRSFAATTLSKAQLAQILWAAQGITGPRGRMRAAPSAGATFPMELLLAVGKGGVDGLPVGVYRYVPSDHALAPLMARDVRREVAAAALGQGFLAEAPVVVLMAADYRRTAVRYGERGARYVHMEVGHIGQNIYLQAEALGLATVAVGAFDDEAIAHVFELPGELAPLYLMPVGYAR